MFKKQTLKTLGYLLLAGHFAFAFCAVSLFHLHTCDGNPWDVSDSSDNCPACVFELGAHTEQPLVVNIPLYDFVIKYVVEEVDQIVQGREPHTILPLRAPPV